jgi:histidine ammonia-lyase
MVENTAHIVAIELMAAAQGIDLRRPLATSPALASMHAALREKAAFLEEDRALAPDIEAVHGLVAKGWFLKEAWGDEAPW